MKMIRMKTVVSAALFSAAVLSGGELVPKSFFTMEKVPAELTADPVPGKEVKFELEENATTGFVWNAKFDPKCCIVNLEHEGPADADKNRMGTPGRVEVEIKRLTDKPCTVVLEYARPWEKDTPPAKTVKVVLGGGAAEVSPASPDASAVKPVLMREDAKFSFASVPAVLSAIIPAGEDFDFEIEENSADSKNPAWKIVKYDSSKIKLEMERDLPDSPGEKAMDEFEIEPLVASGETVVELSCGDKKVMILITIVPAKS